MLVVGLVCLLVLVSWVILKVVCLNVVVCDVVSWMGLIVVSVLVIWGCILESGFCLESVWIENLYEFLVCYG